MGTWSGPVREERHGGVHSSNVVTTSQYLVYKVADEGVQTRCAVNSICSTIRTDQI